MTTDLEAIARRAVACPRWRWMPGMATNSKFRRVVNACPAERVPCCAEEGATEDDCHAVWLEHADILPDLTDPATVGCLLALVREAWGTRVWIRWWGEIAPCMSGRDRSKCEPVDGMGRRIIAPHEFYETEAAALVAALEAAP